MNFSREYMGACHHSPLAPDFHTFRRQTATKGYKAQPAHLRSLSGGAFSHIYHITGGFHSGCLFQCMPPPRSSPTSSESECTERPRKRQRVTSRPTSSICRQLILEEVDLEIALQERLVTAAQSRISWALLLQQALQNDLSGKHRPFSELCVVTDEDV